MYKSDGGRGVISYGVSLRALALTLIAMGSWYRALSRGGRDLVCWGWTADPLGGHLRSLGREAQLGR